MAAGACGGLGGSPPRADGTVATAAAGTKEVAGAAGAGVGAGAGAGAGAAKVNTGPPPVATVLKADEDRGAGDSKPRRIPAGAAPPEAPPAPPAATAAAVLRGANRLPLPAEALPPLPPLDDDATEDADSAPPVAVVALGSTGSRVAPVPLPPYPMPPAEIASLFAWKNAWNSTRYNDASFTIPLCCIAASTE